eukprot:SAG11_NODE_12791_length_685_cov_1.076792_1_plen_45_part_10
MNARVRTSEIMLEPFIWDVVRVLSHLWSLREEVELRFQNNECDIQ